MPVPFKLPRFYPILDTAVLGTRGFKAPQCAEALIEAGARILQYRQKDDWTQAHYDEAKLISERCAEVGVLFVLNDRADFARQLRVALHVGQDDLPPSAARAIISDEIMGFSTHNKQQLEIGDKEPVEYLSLGPIFATTSKLRPDPLVGIDGLRELRGCTQKQLVAIGGLTLENALAVLETKADSLAVISGFLPERGDKKAIRRRAEEWIQLVGV